MRRFRVRPLTPALGTLLLACLVGTPTRAQRGDSAAVRVRAALFSEINTFGQDSASDEQMGALPTFGRVRTLRLIAEGVLRSPRPWRYKVTVDFLRVEAAGPTANAVNDFAAIVPVGRGVSIAVGRQKEGATQQIMASRIVIPFTERSAPISALLPTRNDGIRVTGGTAPSGRWSVGVFNEAFIRHEPFTLGSTSAAARLFIAPVLADGGARVVQFGASGRWAGAPNDSLEFKTSPETNGVTSVVNTGKFAASSAATGGVDALIQWRGVSLSAEGVITWATGSDSADAPFGGYYAEMTWRPGGEHRAYEANNGAFGRVDTRGVSTWELGARYSNVVLDAGSVQGGRFGRASLIAAWYVKRFAKLEVDYGYGTTWRDGVIGHLQLLTTRLRLEAR